MSEVDKLAIAVTLVVALVTVGVMVKTMEQLSSDEFKDQICAEELGTNATYVGNGSDTFDCRYPNGTIVEDVEWTANVTSQAEGWAA